MGFSRPLDRLERGPSRLASHYMLGLAVGSITPIERRKPERRASDSIERIERLLHDSGRSMNLCDIANEFRRRQATVHKWLCDGVAEGRLVIINSRSEDPRYALPENYVSQDRAARDKLQGYAELIAAHPGGVTAGQAASHFGVSLRTARRWLLAGVADGRWRVLDNPDNRSAYLFGAINGSTSKSD